MIEIDGGQHADATVYDEGRTRFCLREGDRILRFWNKDVLENRDGVCARIIELSGRIPRPPAASRRAPPSPTRGEG